MQTWATANSGFIAIGLGIALLGGGDIVLVRKELQSITKAVKIILNHPIAGPTFTGGLSALCFHLYWRFAQID